MIFFWFILACLATQRLSLMFSKESGPARIFRKIRGIPEKHSSFKEGLSCLWCMSVTSSALITLLLLHPTMKLADHQFDWPQTFVFWLAVSSGAIICNQAFTRR